MTRQAIVKITCNGCSKILKDKEAYVIDISVVSPLKNSGDVELNVDFCYGCYDKILSLIGSIEQYV